MPLYVNYDKINGHIEDVNGIKCLTLNSVDENKEDIKK